MGVAEGQAPGQVQMQHLVIAARGGDDLPQGLPIRRRGPHFLLQFPLGGDEGLLAGLPLPGRDLQQRPGEGIAVLGHHGNAAVFVQGQDPYAAGVLHHLPQGCFPVGQGHRVHPQPQDAALVYLPAFQAFFRQIHCQNSSLFFAIIRAFSRKIKSGLFSK